MTGILYSVATPIGNLEDITLRAIRVLKEADAVACEDTRRTGQLLSHLGVKRPMVRYDEHSHPKTGPRILQMVEQGQTVALVTDAGTPAVSDPGQRLVEEALERGLRVVPIPGPSSLTAALSVGGGPAEGFVFLGFLPRRPGKARRALEEAIGTGRKVVLFESPFRVVATMEAISSIRPDAHVFMAREMTKIHEEYTRDSVSNFLSKLKGRALKGECVLIVEPEKKKKEKNDEYRRQ